MLVAGLMSGTSMDGIDAALLKTDGTANTLELKGHYAMSYDPEFKILLKAVEYAIRQNAGDMARARAHFPKCIDDYLLKVLKMLEMNVAEKRESLLAYARVFSGKEIICLEDIITQSTALHAQAVRMLLKQCDCKISEVELVGYHGQTMYHQPNQKISIVIGNGQQLSDELGIAVVNDFRALDIFSGGQGAPFAPLFHLALAVKHDLLPLAVVNCGGIGNITLIPNADPLNIVAYDTGPGNGLIDQFVRVRTKGEEHMDANGKYGKVGRVDQTVLNLLLAHAVIKDGKNYLPMIPPKSLDIGDMLLIPELATLSLEDGCATLEAFTAETIVQSLALTQAEIPKHWVLAGGGWNNPVIRRELGARLASTYDIDFEIHTADEVAWHSASLEAQIFAFLAVRALKGDYLSVPGTTRVPRPITGGQAYLPESGKYPEAVRALLARNPNILTGYAESLKILAPV